MDPAPLGGQPGTFGPAPGLSFPGFVGVAPPAAPGWDPNEQTKGINAPFDNVTPGRGDRSGAASPAAPGDPLSGFLGAEPLGPAQTFGPNVSVPTGIVGTPAPGWAPGEQTQGRTGTFGANPLAGVQTTPTVSPETRGLGATKDNLSAAQIGAFERGEQGRGPATTGTFDDRFGGWTPGATPGSFTSPGWGVDDKGNPVAPASGGRSGSLGLGTQVASLDPTLAFAQAQVAPQENVYEIVPPANFNERFGGFDPMATPTVAPNPGFGEPSWDFGPTQMGPSISPTPGNIGSTIGNTLASALGISSAQAAEQQGGQPAQAQAEPAANTQSLAVSNAISNAISQGLDFSQLAAAGRGAGRGAADPVANAISNIGSWMGSWGPGGLGIIGGAQAATTPQGGPAQGAPAVADPFAAQTTPTTIDPGFQAPQSERSAVTNTSLSGLGGWAGGLANNAPGFGAQGYGYGIGYGNQGYTDLGSPSAGIGFADWGAPPAGTPTAVNSAMDENQSPVAMAAPADARGAFSMGLGAQGLADYYSAMADWASRGWGGTMTGTHAGRHAEGGPVERPSGIASYGPQPPPLPPQDAKPAFGLNDLLSALKRYGYEGGVLTGGAGRGRRADGGIVGDTIKRFVDVSPSAAAGQVDQNPLIGDNLSRSFSPSQLASIFSEVGHNRRDQNPPTDDDNKNKDQQLQINIPGATGTGSTFTGMAEGGYVDAPGYYAPGGLTQAGMHTLGTQAHYSGANVKPAINPPGVHLMSSSSIPGRTDRIPMRAKPGSYVLPADVVSGLGQGNTMAGAKMWGQAIMAAAGPAGAGTMGAIRRGSMPKASVPRMSARTKGFAEGGGMGHNGGPPMEDAYVPIVTAGGEVLVDPELVYALCDGSEMLSKRKLAESVVNVRKQTIAHLKKLPRPVA